MVWWWRLVLSLPLLRHAEAQNWGKTIDVAGRQRMLTQRMSKEFLQVSLDIDPEANANRMRGSINLFNVTLLALINGDDEQGIIGSPNQLVADGLQVVLGLWIPFAQLLLNHVATVRDSSGFVDMAVLTQVANENVPLLVTSNIVVGRLVDAAKSAGAPTNGLVVDTAGRQRMLIQRMCKESMLISQGVNVGTNLRLLKNNRLLFANSHVGIVEGATWAGVPVLSKLCTMHQMREVTYNFQQFSPDINRILNAETPSDSQQIAIALSVNISDKSVPLFASMVAAVQLYVNDQGSCDPAADMTQAGWQDLLMKTLELRKLLEQARQFYLQVGNGIDVANSQVGLVVTLNSILERVDNLVQGNKALDIPAPPTQSALTSLLSVKLQWEELQGSFSPAMTNRDGVTNVEVANINSDSVGFKSAVQQIVWQYETSAIGELTAASDATTEAATGASIHTIIVAEGQKANVVEVAVLANLVAYGERPDENSILMNTTRDTFVEIHFSLLEGQAATDVYPAIAAENDVCFIRKMRTIYSSFVTLENLAQEVRSAGTSSLAEIPQFVDQVIAGYEEVKGYYNQGSIPCSNRTYNLPEWEGLVFAVGRLRALTQEASADFILSTQGVNVERSIASMIRFTAAFRSLAYGDDQLPSPPTQQAVNKILNTVKPAYDHVFNAAAASNVQNFLIQADAVASKCAEIKSMYFNEAQSSLSEFPVQRLEAALDQMYRVNRVVKLALMNIYQLTTTSNTLSQSISEFERVHKDMKEGGGGLPEIVSQREDLLAQWDAVDSAWQRLRSLLLTQSAGDVQNLLDAKMATLQEIDVLAELFSVPDPGVLETFPWMFVAYGLMGAFLLFCACGAAYIHWASRRKRTDAQQQGGWSQA
ncbi:unnamed protein product [Durusdinium trenchii]|uniref:NarX-like N-terminal domain-containing protein n=1 Tax=Durusdinium trenchii TaxID=1381693 RepID=A0ABP0SZ35_9DINO